jgi:hypothetical protein
VGPGAGLDRCGKSRPTGIRSPDLPARNELLYRLSYRGSILMVTNYNFQHNLQHNLLHNYDFLDNSNISILLFL